MIVVVKESQVVGEIDSTLFSLIQQGPVNCAVIIKNVGSNIMNYHFQSFSGSVWTDMDVPGTVLNNTLGINEVKSIVLSSAQSSVRLLGNASGGTTLDFDVTRRAVRPDGGALPILNL